MQRGCETQKCSLSRFASSRLAANLDDWAPASLVSSTPGSVQRAHNLPDWATIGLPYEGPESQGLTAHPSTHVKQELEQDLLRLLDRDMFSKLLHSFPARALLRAWLVKNEPGVGARKLDHWTDEQRLVGLKSLLQDQCDSIFRKTLTSLRVTSDCTNCSCK